MHQAKLIPQLDVDGFIAYVWKRNWFSWESEAVVFVYMLRCRDGSLYTGQTNDLETRLRQHAEGTGAKYVRGRRPFELVYVEEVETRSDALRRENSLRKLSKHKKESLIRKKKDSHWQLPPK